MVRAKSPFGCSSSRILRYCLTSRRYANLSSSLPAPSTLAAYEYNSRACPSRSRPILASAMSSSMAGAWPHHSDSRCPRISASSARRSAYSTSGVSGTEMEAMAMFNNLFVLTRHCEERSDEAIHSFFLRDGLLRYARNDGTASHMPNFIRHVVECRVAIDLGFRGLEHHALLGRIGRRDRVRRYHPDREPLAAPGVDVARGLQRQRGVAGMQRSDMLVRQAVAAANKDLP